MTFRGCHVKSIICWLTILLVVLIGGCSSDKPNEPQEPVKSFVQFTEYRVFNTDRLVKVSLSESSCEPILTWEGLIGEPFYDHNGDGVYEPGIDVFIRSADPLVNQDLNFNGRYDGPETPCEYWEYVWPWDDLDGDGFVRCPSSDECPRDAAAFYMPFVDWDGNGKWTTGTSMKVWLAKWRMYSNDTLVLDHVDSAYYYHSARGLDYFLRSHGVLSVYPVAHDSLLGLTTSGGIFDFSGMDSLAVGVSVLDTMWRYRELITARRRVFKLANFVTADSTYTDLLLIRFDSLTTEYGLVLTEAYNEFYFLKSTGLIAVKSQDENGGHGYCWIESYLSSLPIHMTKVNRP